MVEKDMKHKSQECTDIRNEEVRKINPIPNYISFLRILGTFSLFFVDATSVGFFVIYTLCGISDVVDGVIARATNSTSELGAKLDSIADMLFYGVMLVKILPILIDILPLWVWCIVGAILLIRVISYVMAAIKFRKFASLHTYMNKLTGFSIFLTPYFVRESFGYIYCVVVCVVAGIASIEELLIHLFRKDYNSGVSAITQIK